MLSPEEKGNLNLNFSFSRTFFLFLPSFYHSKHFTTIPLSGETKKPLTLTEGRLGLTRRRPNYPPTGTHPSPRSASVWRLANRSGLLSSTSRRIPCTLWSLMGNTAKPHLAVKRGSHWLVLMPPCSTTVTRKDLTPGVIGRIMVEQESVSLVTMSPTAVPVAPELGLVLEGGLIRATHVETMRGSGLIMVWSSSRPWGTSWCSKKKPPRKKILFVEVFLVSRSHFMCLFGRQSDSSSLWAAVCTLTLKRVLDYKWW